MKLLIGWLGRAISALVYFSPRFLLKVPAWFLAFLWFDVLRIRRKVILDNTRIAFPEWEESKRKEVARKSMRYLALGFLEYFYLPWIKSEKRNEYFEYHNLELARNLLARGKGLLGLTLHLGHGDMAIVGLAMEGLPIAIVSKEFKWRWLNDLWFGLRAKFGVIFIPPRNSSFALLKGLKKGQFVVIPLDQFTGPPIGVRTKFFGRETGTAAGLAIMAQRSGAPVVSVYTRRLENGKHAIYFANEISTEGDVETVTQRFNDEIETYVRQFPEQWMWLHKRWKRFVVR